MQGYKAQATMVVGALDQLVGRCEARRESLVCEGVHLSIKHVVALMQRHPTIVPFLVHISNEAKHRERFAVSTTRESRVGPESGPTPPQHEKSRYMRWFVHVTLV